MAEKTGMLYTEIFKKIFEYITINFDNNELELKSVTINFEEGLINGFMNIFKENIKDLHHIGCFFII